jgi:UDPglucose 6-dehydrogenase
VIGTGYVGLVTALAFAHHGHRVTCVDIIQERVEQVSQGVAPFYEPGVADALREHITHGTIEATIDVAAAVADSEATFLCVGTPSAPDGSYDMTQLESASRAIGEALGRLDRHHIVVTKSTVSPTTNRKVVLKALEEASGKRAPGAFSLVSNPEFLREGSALADALAPDRIVLGLMGDDDTASDLLQELYSPFGCPILVTSLEGAELIKLASNSLLAIKIAFANEVANLSAAVGADGYQVLEGVGLDHRLGPHFLRAGAGFGGSCFPKDLHALVAFSESLDTPALMPMAALDQNEIQPMQVVRMVMEALGPDLTGTRVALLGLSFKPETDDVRETRALPIYKALLELGAEVVCHDPQAGRAFAALVLEAGLEAPQIAASFEEALEEAAVAVIQTEWGEYKDIEPAKWASLLRAPPIVVDARRTLDPVGMASAGVTYYGVGWPHPG